MKEAEFMLLLGNNIRTARTRKNKTQTDLAHAIGRSVASVSKYERGECAIDIYTLNNIADELGVRVSQLIPTKTRLIGGDAQENQWSLLRKYDKLYLYTIGYVAKRPNCSVIEFNWEENKATIYVDTYADFEEKGNLLSNIVLQGKVYATSACTVIMTNNPVVPIDFFNIVINSADWYSGKPVCYVSYTTLNWRSATSRGVLTTIPKCPENLNELLAFSKEELRQIKKSNRLVL